jgi:hypothetical protein
MSAIMKYSKDRPIQAKLYAMLGCLMEEGLAGGRSRRKEAGSGQNPEAMISALRQSARKKTKEKRESL